MNKVFVVKSYSELEGYLNLKAFSDYDKAEDYAKEVETQCGEGEWMEIEELSLH
jgi:hypothetical protein